MTVDVSLYGGFVTLLNPDLAVSTQSAYVLIYAPKIQIATQSAYVMLAVGTRATVAVQSAYIAIFDPTAGITKRRRVSAIMSSYAA